MWRINGKSCSIQLKVFQLCHSFGEQNLKKYIFMPYAIFEFSILMPSYVIMPSPFFLTAFPKHYRSIEWWVARLYGMMLDSEMRRHTTRRFSSYNHPQKPHISPCHHLLKLCLSSPNAFNICCGQATSEWCDWHDCFS